MATSNENNNAVMSSNNVKELESAGKTKLAQKIPRKRGRNMCSEESSLHLEKYKKKFGHLNTPTSYITEKGTGVRLGSWVKNIRCAHAKHRANQKDKKGISLSVFQIKKLHHIGFDFKCKGDKITSERSQDNEAAFF